jgi:hypothetical protein
MSTTEGQHDPIFTDEYVFGELCKVREGFKTGCNFDALFKALFGLGYHASKNSQSLVSAHIAELSARQSICYIAGLIDETGKWLKECK